MKLRPFPSIDIVPATLLAFLLTYLLNEISPINLQFIPGIFLLFFLPGYTLLSLFPRLSTDWGVLGKISLSTTLSILLFATIQLGLLAAYPDFKITALSQTLLVLIPNAILYLIGKFRKQSLRFSSPAIALRTLSEQKLLILALTAPAIILLATVLLNPLSENADNFLLATKHVVENGVFELGGFRILFVHSIALQHFFLNLDYVVLYRISFVAVFYFASLALLDYAVRNYSNRTLGIATYLLFLGSAVIVTETNIIRPQVALTGLTIPVLILLTCSLQKMKAVYALLAFYISFILLGFHELSVVLVFVSAVTLLVHLGRAVFVTKKITWKQLLLAAVIVFPYFKIINLAGYFGEVTDRVELALSLFPPLQWNWWFIDNYTTVDGVNLGWPGIQAAQYYLYNGILVLVLCGALLTVALKQRKLSLSTLPTLLYVAVFFCFAELLPRLGVNFLPNRAWIHLMLGVAVFVSIIAKDLSFSKKQLRYLLFLQIIIVIIGIGGTLYVAQNNVSNLYHDELPAARFIREQTPSDSLFLSTQDNSALILFYGKRNYDQLEVRKQIGKTDFEKAVGEILAERSSEQKIILLPERSILSQTFEEGTVIASSKQIVRAEKAMVKPALYSEETSVYFIYSYKKLTGISGQREYLQPLIDRDNRDLYVSLGYPVVYKDDHVAIIKLR